MFLIRFKARRASEKTFENRLPGHVKKLGGVAIKFWSNVFTGMPDRMVLMPGGRIYFVELKSEGQYLKKNQKPRCRMLRRLGFMVWVISTNTQYITFLQTIANEN